MKPLSSYLGEIGGGGKSTGGLPPPQSPMAARAALEMISAQTGIKMRSLNLVKTERGYELRRRKDVN